jgi:hypothetical protein
LVIFSTAESLPSAAKQGDPLWSTCMEVQHDVQIQEKPTSGVGESSEWMMYHLVLLLIAEQDLLLLIHQAVRCVAVRHKGCEVHIRSKHDTEKEVHPHQQAGGGAASQAIAASTFDRQATAASTFNRQDPLLYRESSSTFQR